jgi:hypothetical protein
MFYQADDVIKELSAPVTDAGKVHRGLRRLAAFGGVESGDRFHCIVSRRLWEGKRRGTLS